jgi:hypothetical protein
MPAANFPEYVRELQATLNDASALGEVEVTTLQVDQRSALRGLVAGSLQFYDGSILHFREFVDLSQAEPKLTYAYHYQTAAAVLIFRYDNATHRPPLSQAAHKHTPAGTAVSSIPTLREVVDHILQQMSEGRK